MLEDLHFIRPLWLLAIPIGWLVTSMMFRLGDSRLAWRGVIAPHLLDALTIHGGRRSRVSPALLARVCAVVCGLALAGPAWQREPKPFAEEDAVMVVVVEVTESMTAQDVQPSRLVRAGQKVADLLALRPGTDAALIAYAGTAHVAMPITRDGAIIAEFASALSPDVMPVDGEDVAAALALARSELERSRRSGSIVLISDGLDPGVATAAADAAGVPVHALSVSASPPGEGLKGLGGLTGGSTVRVTADDGDVRRLAAGAERRFGTAAVDDSTRWRDGGFWLVPLVAMFTLAWGRRGWAMRYPETGGSG